MQQNKVRNKLFWLLVFIAAATLVSGLLQMLKPDFILAIIEGEQSAANQHTFAIVGMFMLLFGGLTLHGLLSTQHHPVIMLWSGLQKLGAFAAVGIGVTNDLFATIAWAVALFDLFSGVLLLYYWHSIKD